MPADWVTIARVIKTQGRFGELAAAIETDDPERFAMLQRVYLVRPPAPPVAFPLKRSWFHKGWVVLELEGIADLNAAESWVGADVVIPFEERAPLPPGKWYFSDLEGCTVFSGETAIGVLIAVEDMPGGELLHVRSGAGDEVLIPFVSAWIQLVDLDARSIHMQLPEGLLELNAGSAPALNPEKLQARRQQRKEERKARLRRDSNAP